MTSVTATSVVRAMQRSIGCRFAVTLAPSATQKNQREDGNDKHKSDGCRNRHHVPQGLLRVVQFYTTARHTPKRLGVT